MSLSSLLSRRDWLRRAGATAGASLVAPSLVLADAPRRAQGATSSPDELLELERAATAARVAAGPIRLASNENPYGMSPRAKAAMLGDGWVEHSQYSPASYGALTRAFAASVGVTPEHVLITQGSREVLCIAGLSYSRPGSDVVVPWPTFEGLPEYADTIGATVHRVPLTEEQGHDFAMMDRHITHAATLTFVCNPNNPTGTLADTRQLREFVRSAATRTMVVVDEAYHDFVTDAQYESMIDLVKAGENVIISRTASKIHGLAGARIGFAIARPDIIARLRRFTTGVPNALGMNAAIAALADTTYQAFVKQRNAEGRDRLTAAIRGMGKRVIPSQTNFVFFHAGIPTERVQAAMRAKGLLIGRTFQPYTDWCRISIGTPDEITACIAALPEAVRA
jgi:histidinol-phosphate aminotransferase